RFVFQRQIRLGHNSNARSLRIDDWNPAKPMFLHGAFTFLHILIEEWPLARSLTRGEVVRDEEIEYVRGDGTPVFLSVSSAPILDYEGHIIAAVITFFDLTHRKGTEEVLRTTEKLAATGRLTASFGHEINNPLQTLGSVLPDHVQLPVREMFLAARFAIIDEMAAPIPISPHR